MSRVTDLIAARGITVLLQQSLSGDPNLQPPLSDDETRELTALAAKMFCAYVSPTGPYKVVCQGSALNHLRCNYDHGFVGKKLAAEAAEKKVADG